MAWTLTRDPGAFAGRAWELLAARPADNTIALTMIEAIRAGHRWSDEPMLFGWHDDGGAVLMTPPYELLLALVPPGTEAGLVAALRDAGVAVPGVNGAVPAVERFAAAWGSPGTPVLELRLHVLGTLVPPSPPPAGAPRRAGAGDLELVLAWSRAFVADTGVRGEGVAALARERLAGGRTWLWEDGGPVALAGRTLAVGGVTRINAVYTPAEHRRRGYGAGATVACAADALESGATGVVLFTDLANPTSNALYRRLGFEPAADHRVVRF